MHERALAVTAGEPAGIGFDIILKAHQHLQDCVIIGDQNALQVRAQQLALNITFTNQTATDPQQLQVKHIATTEAVIAGQLNANNAAYVLACLDEAIDGTLAGQYAAIVTAPLHKGIINDAGIAFTGHTEYLADRTDSKVVMLLVADSVRVALATTHLPLTQVASHINQPLIVEIATILNNDLIKKFAINNPHIAVCGLNPHAGEQGHLGHEEIEIIEPAISQLQQAGINVSGPYPADTIFTPKHLAQVDAVLAMYHDQGLPTLKHLGFGRAVNTTLGLPIIRTSVDHGTALDLAGTGRADASSLIAAVKLARSQTNSNQR